MSDHVSILSRQENEWVDMWLREGIHPDNHDLVLRVLERMRAELDAWHRLNNEMSLPVRSLELSRNDVGLGAPGYQAVLPGHSADDHLTDIS